MKFTTTLFALAMTVGCTSFTFKKGGKDEAPSELKDRSVMISVPSGTFEMGAQNAEPDEYPEHKVEISQFLIDKTEVTLGDYMRCVKAKACAEPLLADDVKEAMTELHPVTGVSWYDAKKYCDWVEKRLPTEAEWEFAARYKRDRKVKFPFDAGFGPDVVNARGKEDGFERTAPVGSFPKGASSLGILDLAGNAAEWTADWYESTYYQKTPPVNPKGPEAPTGSKVYRGGSWSDPEYPCRSTARLSLDPNTSNDAVGFRCAAS